MKHFVTSCEFPQTASYHVVKFTILNNFEVVTTVTKQFEARFARVQFNNSLNFAYLLVLVRRGQRSFPIFVYSSSFEKNFWSFICNK